MPRANRHFLPGYIWHITHRCHNRSFLLKHHIDRHRWIQELGKAKRRYKLRILNYIATSNHIHLLVFDPDGSSIPRAMQWVAGQTAERYNQRRNRTGAFWNDRYHATAIDKNDYLWKCMLYIHLNMVRAGVVNHPEEWFPSAFNEIQSPRKRYGLLAWSDLLTLLELKSVSELQNKTANQVADALENGIRPCDRKWSESIAVGHLDFLQIIQGQLGYRIKGRKIRSSDNIMHISDSCFKAELHDEMHALIGENSFEWDNSQDFLAP